MEYALPAQQGPLASNVSTIVLLGPSVINVPRNASATLLYMVVTRRLVNASVSLDSMERHVPISVLRANLGMVVPKTARNVHLVHLVIM